MENKINIARFKEGSRTAEVKGIWQWDYGQILRIQGLNLPTAVEIHFSLDERGGEALRRIGITQDGVTDVVIPDSMVENESAYGDSYYFFAYIYLTDETSGNTEYKIRAKVSTRSKPEGYVSGGNDTFAEILKTVNKIAEDKVDIPVPAKAGQVLAVKATDESGKPTEFEATDPIEETDPTVPEWAKQPEKPSYTAEEVGALPAGTKIPSKTSDLQNDSKFTTLALDETLTDNTKAAPAGMVGELKSDLNELKQNGTVVSSVEPADNDIPKVFFDEAIPQTKTDTVSKFRYVSKTKDIEGYVQFKAQGNSSMSYPKKNQTVKMYKDEALTEKIKVDFKGWGKQNKHVYKANWIDLTHSRNIVSARLWGQLVKTRSAYNELPELYRTSPNQGAVDGFPIKVYSQGIYQGRYTLNIPKDKWMANMDDSLDAHCILCGENYVSGCFRATANIDGTDWTDEVHDVVPESIKTRWNEIISFVMNSADEEFKANLSNYFYIDSLIDKLIFGVVACDLDGFGKNQIYYTYDGQKWIAGKYDMDSTFGLWWNGSSFVASDYARESFQDFKDGQGNLLYIRLAQLFYEEVQTRWNEVKDTVLSAANIINEFEKFTDIASNDLVKEDYARTTANGKFTGIPSQSTNNIQQIRKYIVDRRSYCETYFESLTPEVEVPCTGITLSSDTITFTEAGTQTLTATVTPDGCTDEITWESDNTSIATVTDGVVTAIANGSANITAKCGEYSAVCTVAVSGMVESIPCAGITLDKTELVFDGKGTQTIVATVEPSGTTDSVVWVSSNPAVASIAIEGNICTVQSVGNGDTTITVTCGNQSASCGVKVNGIALLLDGISVHQGALLETGEFKEDSTSIYTDPFDMSKYTGKQLFQNVTGNSSNWSRILFYDENDTLISYVGSRNSALTVPTDTDHARISLYSGDLSYELFDKFSIPSDKWVKGCSYQVDGTFKEDDANSSYTEIDISGGEKLIVGYAWGVCYFDANGAFISSNAISAMKNTYAFTVPDNTVKAIINTETQYIDNSTFIARPGVNSLGKVVWE